MSAFQVSDEQIKLIAVWAQGTHGRLDLSEITADAAKLWQANSDSLQARYGEGSEGEAPTVSLNDHARAKFTDAVNVLSLIQCYEHQACEFEGWPESAGHRLAERARDCAIRALPGYKDAPWSI